MMRIEDLSPVGRSQLDRIERELRRWRLGASLAFLAVGTVVLLGQRGQGANQVVEAQRFMLKDASGSIRANLMSFPDGRTVLDLIDRAGFGVLSLAVSGEGLPRIQLLDRSHQIRAALLLTHDQRPFLTLNDAAGREVSRLGVRTDGSAFLVLADRNDTTRLWLNLGPDGRPSVGLYGSDGRARGLLGQLGDGRAALQFVNATGDLLWQAP